MSIGAKRRLRFWCDGLAKGHSPIFKFRFYKFRFFKNWNFGISFSFFFNFEFRNFLFFYIFLSFFFFIFFVSPKWAYPPSGFGWNPKWVPPNPFYVSAMPPSGVAFVCSLSHATCYTSVGWTWPSFQFSNNSNFAIFHLCTALLLACELPSFWLMAWHGPFDNVPACRSRFAFCLRALRVEQAYP